MILKSLFVGAFVGLGILVLAGSTHALGIGVGASIGTLTAELIRKFGKR